MTASTDDAITDGQRHCSVCLQAMKSARVCGGCRRRAYCSSQCQSRDWKVNGGGQSHKIWCQLRCGEEDLDWKVAAIPGKGLGVVALRPIPAGYRIMVDGIRTPGDPVLLDLEPKGGTLAQKLSLNKLGVSDDRGEVCARMSRVNHDCNPNAEYKFDDTYQVQILFSGRPIAAGEEITISYRFLSGRTPDQVRALLRQKYAIECPPTCACYDAEFVQYQARADALEQSMNRLLTQPHRSLAAAQQLLDLYDRGRYGVSLAKFRTLHAAWQVAIMSRKTLPKANGFIRQAIAILKQLLAPSSTLLLQVERHALSPSSHEAFLLYDRLCA